MQSHSLASFWNRARKSAILFAFLGTAVRLGSNALMLPLVLLKLSEEELAIWVVFLALGNFANLADFGFGQCISRAYSHLWAGAEGIDEEGLTSSSHGAPPNLPRLRELNTTVRFLYLRLSLGAMLLLALAGPAFLWRDVQTAAHPARIWTCWGAYLLVVGYGMVTTQWVYASQGVNRVRDIHQATLWGNVCYLIIAGTLLLIGMGLASLVIGTAIRSFVSRHIARKAYGEAVPTLAGDVTEPNLELLRKLWPNARKFGVLSIGGYLIGNGMPLISSHYLDKSLQASVGLTWMIGTFVSGIAVLWTAVKWPQITMLRTQGRLREMGDLFARRLGMVLVSYMVMAIGVLMFGNALLRWKGTPTRLLPGPYLAAYLFYLGLQVNYVQFGILTFTENVIPFFKISLLTGVGMICLSTVLTSQFGLWGLVLAPLLAESVCSNWYTLRRGFQGQPLRPTEFLRAALSFRL